MRGFSLIELMIALAVVAILAVIATFVYPTYVYKSKRLDAINTLMAISLAEQRYRSSNTQYGSLAQVWNGVTTSDQGYYTLSIGSISANSYTVTATAIGGQSNDRANGVSCASMSLAVVSSTITRSPAACWDN